jgi:(DL)-glycerol-3-phosphatase
MDIKRKQLGRSSEEARRILIEELQLPLTPDELRAIAHRAEEVNLQMATELPGVRRLVEHLHACGIPMCIASGSDERGFKLKTRQIEDLISKMTHFVLAGK